MGPGQSTNQHLARRQYHISNRAYRPTMPGRQQLTLVLSADLPTGAQGHTGAPGRDRGLTSPTTGEASRAAEMGQGISTVEHRRPADIPGHGRPPGQDGSRFTQARREPAQAYRPTPGCILLQRSLHPRTATAYRML